MRRRLASPVPKTTAAMQGLGWPLVAVDHDERHPLTGRTTYHLACGHSVERSGCEYRKRCYCGECAGVGS
jgi:hypothetical protein